MMIMRHSMLLYAVLAGLGLHAQLLEWAGQIEGTYHSPVQSLCVDPTGDLLCTGFFQGTTDFDLGPGVDPLLAPNAEQYIYVAKYQPNGELQWAEKFGSGTPSTTYGTNIATDDSGAIFVTGNFCGVGDFDPGPGSLMLDAVGYDGFNYPDVFAMKLDGSGGLIWAVQLGDSSSDYSRDMILDHDGNVILAINIADTVDMDPGPGIDILYNQYFQEVVLVKLDPNGALLWYRDLGGSEAYPSMSLTSDALGNIWVATNGHLRKYDPLGNQLLDEPLASITNDAAVDMMGNVYLTGSFTGTADMDPGSGQFNLSAVGWYDLFCMKLNADGDFQWAVQLGSSAQTFAVDVEIEGSGDILISGGYEASLDLDPGPGVFMASYQGGREALIIRLDSAGLFQEAMTLSGAGDQFLFGCAPAGPSQWIAYGGFEESFDVDAGPGVVTMTCDTYSDGLIARYASGSSYIPVAPVEGAMVVYPTPTSGLISVTGLPLEAREVILVNAMGEELDRRTLGQPSSLIEMDLSAHPDGPYWIRVTTSNATFTEPVILVR